MGPGSVQCHQPIQHFLFCTNFHLAVANAKLGDTKSVTSKLVSGWQVNGIGTIPEPGFHSLPWSDRIARVTAMSRNPDRVSLNPSPLSPCPVMASQWLNPCLYSLPTAGTYGNIGRGTLTGPGLADVDLSLFKDTAVTEKNGCTVPG